MYKRHDHAHDAFLSVPFACFQCRKCFHLRLWALQIDTYQPPCPQCRGTLSYMGTAFKAPKRQQIKQWQTVELLIQRGFRFSPSAGRMPQTLREARVFIAQHMQHAEKQTTLLAHSPKPTRRGR